MGCADVESLEGLGKGACSCDDPAAMVITGGKGGHGCCAESVRNCLAEGSGSGADGLMGRTVRF